MAAELLEVTNKIKMQEYVMLLEAIVDSTTTPMPCEAERHRKILSHCKLCLAN